MIPFFFFSPFISCRHPQICSVSSYHVSGHLQNRDIRIAVIKGIGIILMVMGQVKASDTDVICLFHMAVFFLDIHIYSGKVRKEILPWGDQAMVMPSFLLPHGSNRSSFLQIPVPIPFFS